MDDQAGLYVRARTSDYEHVPAKAPRWAEYSRQQGIFLMVKGRTVRREAATINSISPARSFLALVLLTGIVAGCGGSSPKSSPPDTDAPTAPAALTATPASQTQIDLAWAPAADNVAVSQYFVERCTGAGCTDFTQVATSPTTAYSDGG